MKHAALDGLSTCFIYRPLASPWRPFFSLPLLRPSSSIRSGAAVFGDSRGSQNSSLGNGPPDRRRGEEEAHCVGGGDYSSINYTRARQKGVRMKGWKRSSSPVSESTTLLSSVSPSLASRVISSSLSRGFRVLRLLRVKLGIGERICHWS